MQGQLDRAYEEIEEVRYTLQSLKDSIEKQPFISAPSPYEILGALSDFLKSDLDKCIQGAEMAVEVIESIEVEEVA